MYIVLFLLNCCLCEGLFFKSGTKTLLNKLFLKTKIQTSSPDSSNENSPATPPDEQGQGDAPPQLEDEEPAFPHTDLAKLDDMINR